MVKKLFAGLILTIVWLICIPFNAVFASTSASSIAYDFKDDETFSMDNFPVDINDNSLHVVQIGESTEDELLVYIYQPSGASKDLRASSINICVRESGSYINFALQYLCSDGTLYKYKVKNYLVSAEIYRTYKISSIMRPWDSRIDDVPEGQNEITEVAYPVGQQWNCMTVADGVVYSMQNLDVVTITDKYVGYIRFTNGFYLFQHSCDSHFVVFSTDRNMDDLYEIELDYYITPYHYVMNGYQSGLEYKVEENTYADERIHKTKTVTHLESGQFTQFGWTGKKYSWDRIRKADEFLADPKNSVSDEAREHFTGKQWVVSFDETEYAWGGNSTATSSTQFANYSRVEELTILRLKFSSEGKVYNLGVVDNKVSQGVHQSADGVTVVKPDPDWWKWALAVIALIVILVIFGPWVICLIKAVLKGIFWLICLPFKLIAKLVSDIKLRRGRKDKANSVGRDLGKMSREEVEKELDEIDWDSDFWKNIDGTDGG